MLGSAAVICQLDTTAHHKLKLVVQIFKGDIFNAQMLDLVKRKAFQKMKHV